MNRIISTVQNFLNTVSLQPGGKILAAVSGGADSVAMLHLLRRVAATEHSEVDGSLSFPRRRESSDGKMDPRFHENHQSSIINYQFQLICAHINHQLRGADSDADERFTAELCDKLNISFFAERIDVKTYAAQKKLSIETAARQLRLAALVRLARRTDCQYIATAHHKDDQAETILFRLLRGTAFPGLTGIHPVIERSGLQWIRPMLHLRRTDIESYCRQNNLSWREDASNAETHFRRNWIRHCLLPAVQQNSEKDLTETLAALAQSALALQQQVESAAAEIFQSTIDNRQSKIHLSSSSVHHAGPFVAGEILRIALNHLHCGLQDMSLSHYRRFFQLLDKNRAVLELPGGCTIRKKNDTLTFKTANPAGISQSSIINYQSSIQLSFEGTVQFGPWRIQTHLIQITQNDLKTFQKLWESETVLNLNGDNLNGDSHLFPDTSTAAASEGEPISQSSIINHQSSISFRQWFDLAKIQSPIVARCRRDDDSFIPFGRKTSKKITRFLADSQIDPKQKESCFVIEDKTGVLWLAPLRRAARAVVVKDTIDVLEIRIVPSPAKI